MLLGGSPVEIALSCAQFLPQSFVSLRSHQTGLWRSLTLEWLSRLPKCFPLKMIMSPEFYLQSVSVVSCSQHSEQSVHYVLPQDQAYRRTAIAGKDNKTSLTSL